MVQASGHHFERERTSPYCPGQVHPYRDSKLVMAGDDSVDKLLYHNLVEMIPLVESLMQDQQTTKSFPRHASLVYTPTPSREAWPFKKAVENSTIGKPRRGQLVPSKRGELKDSSLWDNAENVLHNEQDLYAEEIPLLPFPSNHRANRVVVPSVEILQLRSKVQQLEQKLYEKECQLQTMEKNAKQIHLQLNATVERLQSQIQQKDHSIQKVQDQLFEKQLEVVSLQSLVKKSEVNVQASSMKTASLEEELDGLRCQFGALLFLAQSHASSFEEERAADQPEISATLDKQTMDMQVNEAASLQLQDSEEEHHMEEMRRKYVAALHAAREDPSEEMLSLVAELRTELQALMEDHVKI